jgi:hypothetical protein
MESIQIYLNSKNADAYINGASDCEYNLPLIEIPDGFHIYLSVVSCLIPFSFYNVNNSNNNLYYSFDGSTMTNLTIPIGNYNINDLVKYFKLNMTGFTTTYNQNSNKLTFTHSQNNFMFMSNSTCLSILGFNDNTTVISTALSLTSINCVNVYNIKTIQVNSNLITYNINKVQKNNYCILCSVPVSSQPFSLIEYINRTNFRTNLFLNRIQKLKIRLTDDNGNLIDLNGCHYTMTLQLDVVDFT